MSSDIPPFNFAPDVPFSLSFNCPAVNDVNLGEIRKEGYLGHGPYYSRNNLPISFTIYDFIRVYVKGKIRTIKGLNFLKNIGSMSVEEQAKVLKAMSENVEEDKEEPFEQDFSVLLTLDRKIGVEHFLRAWKALYPGCSINVIKPDLSLHEVIIQDVKKGLFKIQRNTRVELEVIGWKKTPENHKLWGETAYIEYLKEHKVWDKSDKPFYLYSRKPDVDNPGEPTAILRPRVVFRYHEPRFDNESFGGLVRILYDLPVTTHDRKALNAPKDPDREEELYNTIIENIKAVAKPFVNEKGQTVFRVSSGTPCLLPQHAGTSWEDHFDFLFKEYSKTPFEKMTRTFSEFLAYDLQVLDASGNTVVWWNQFLKALETYSNIYSDTSTLNLSAHPAVSVENSSDVFRKEYDSKGYIINYDASGNWKVK